MTDLVVVGTGGQARELHATIETLGAAWNPLGFLDDNKTLEGSVIHSLPVLGGIDWLETRPHLAAAVGVGSSALRRAIVQRILSLGPRLFPTLIDPTASVGRRVTFGDGAFISPGVVVTTDVSITNHVLINFGSSVGHDAVIDEFVSVGPGARISGAVHLAEGSEIGTGAVIVQGLSVGKWCVVGAGAVVLNDVPPDTTVVGVPAKVIKERPPGWHLRRA